VSARHVHLCEKDLEILFGENYKLKKECNLSQHGQYKAKEKVIIKNNDNTIENVSVLGPLREKTQIEISKTDAYKLKLNPPVRNSNDLKNSSPITIIGTKGKIMKNEGCIIATRHIHISKKEALKYNLDDSIVSVKVSGEKKGIMENVYIKKDDSYTFEMHIDLDDANAHLIKTGDFVEIIKN